MKEYQRKSDEDKIEKMLSDHEWLKSWHAIVTAYSIPELETVIANFQSEYTKMLEEKNNPNPLLYDNTEILLKITAEKTLGYFADMLIMKLNLARLVLKVKLKQKG